MPYASYLMQNRPRFSPAWKAYAEAAVALGARLTREALGPGLSAKRLDDLARRLQRELDGMMERAFASLPEAGEPACAAGCDHCCRTLPVIVTPNEVFTLARRVRDLVEAHPTLAARVAASEPTAAAGAALRTPVDPWSRLAPTSPPAPGSLPPCPLLGENGLCLAYSSRPLACRGCVSADATACAACDESRPVPSSTAHQLGAAAMARGVCDALDSLGLVSRPLDIRAGLAIALADASAERRWLRGEDVFGQQPAGK